MVHALSTTLSSVFTGLNSAQRTAADWEDGPMLVLAGPGSGKTRVLTTRLAKLLETSPDERFRVLALTFTNKAAGEMLSRVHELTAGAHIDRTFVGTFHAFCIEVLQSQGSHVGVKSGFQVYSMNEDREAVFAEALTKAAPGERIDNKQVLSYIDRLRAKLIEPAHTAGKFKDPERGKLIAHLYQAYEDSLREANALDFPGLLLEAARIFQRFPAIAERYRRTYRYWLLDEFQDSNHAQYGLLKAMAGNDFRNIFAVADDDQIIYRWNGASYKQLEAFQKQFSPTVIQLPTNYRCPPEVVAAANALIVHNSERSGGKAPLIAGKPGAGGRDVISLIHADDDEAERSEVVARIATVPVHERSRVAVLARTKALLDKTKQALQDKGIKAGIAARRDAFVSAGFTWMQAVLRQIVRPQDERNFVILTTAFNRLGGATQELEAAENRSVETGQSLLSSWLAAQEAQAPHLTNLVTAVRKLAAKPADWRVFVSTCQDCWLAAYQTDQLPLDVSEDAQAWKEIAREIDQAIGRDASLEDFLHRLDITSKEPSLPDDCVVLMTIHGAKGKEFKDVFLIGMAEGELPSWQSLKDGADPGELEEERRNCFVAITRTEERLTISYADRYRGYAKRPSRFLAEMGLLSKEVPA